MTDDANGEALAQKKYAVQSGKQDLVRFFQDPHWTLSLLTTVGSSFLLPPDCLKMQSMVDEQWNKLGTDRDVDDATIGERIDAINDLAFRQMIEKTVMYGHCQKINSLDQFTQVAYETVYDDDPRQPLDFTDLSESFFMKAYAPGTFHKVIGPVTIESVKRGDKGKKALGVGKTNTEGSMMQMQARNGWEVIANYAIKDPPEHIHLMYDLKQIFISCIENLQQGRKTMVVIDEIAQCVPKIRATGDNSLILGQIAFLLRKVGAALTVISQRQNDIPTVIDSMVESTIMKKSQTVMTFEYGNKDYLIRNVPATTLQYDHRWISPFLIKFDIQGMHSELQEAMSKGDPNIDQFQIILDYLKADQMEINEKMLKNYAVVAYVSGAKQKKIAETISTFRSCSQSTVSRWLNDAGITTGDD
jgi:hypothetical protein